MTAATTRKAAKKFKAWAAVNPRRPGQKTLEWVRAGVLAVTGAAPRGPIDRAAKPVPSWTPQGAADRLEEAVDKSPEVRRELAVDRAALVVRKTAFFAQFAAEDSAALRAWMDAPIAALKGQPIRANELMAPKAAAAATAAAIRRAAA